MSYTDLRDFDAEYTTEVDGLVVEVEKLGGGTVGKAYEGTWRYRTSEGDEGQDLITGTPKTHVEAAAIVAEYFTTEV